MQGSAGHLIWTICYLSVLFGLSAYGVHRYFIIYLFLKHRKQAPVPASHFDELPVVTVQLPIFNEIYVVERLLKSVSELDYPADRLHIQVLDDSTDETREITASCVNRLKERGLNVELIQRTDRSGFKAGALEVGMATAGDFVCILDADFVPQPELLQKTIHFFTDPNIGMIQTRWGHLNRSYSLLTRVQAMFLDGHLLLEQTARSRSGRFFNFNGTAGLWRKRCIEEAGGWQHDTLTEDLDLSYRAQLAGWRFVLPVECGHAGRVAGRHEWLQVAAASLDEGLNPDLQQAASHDLAQQAAVPDQARGDRPPHLELRVSAPRRALSAAASIGRRPQSSWMRTLLIDLPIFLTASCSVAVFYICAQRELHPKTWMKEMLLLPPMLALGVGLSISNARAVLEAMFNHQSDFARTPKYGIERKKQPWRNAKYMPLKSLLPLLELAFGLYFTYFLWFAIQHQQWFSVPFLMIFQLGFLYVAFSSMSQWWPRFSSQNSRAEVALPA
jgi:GT2 family glycosyltransferase